MRTVGKWQPYREQAGPSELWGVRLEGQEVFVIRATTKLDAEDVALICATHNAALEKGEGIFVESLVSSKTGEPLMQLTVKNVTVQMTLYQAREHQRVVGEMIEAAVTDSFIARWVRTRLYPDRDRQTTDHAVAHLISDFRAYRDELSGRTYIEDAAGSDVPSQ